MNAPGSGQAARQNHDGRTDGSPMTRSLLPFLMLASLVGASGKHRRPPGPALPIGDRIGIEPDAARIHRTEADLRGVIGFDGTSLA